jgi:hypothetical protein
MQHSYNTRGTKRDREEAEELEASKRTRSERVRCMLNSVVVELILLFVGPRLRDWRGVVRTCRVFHRVFAESVVKQGMSVDFRDINPSHGPSKYVGVTSARISGLDFGSGACSDFLGKSGDVRHLWVDDQWAYSIGWWHAYVSYNTPSLNTSALFKKLESIRIDVAGQSGTPYMPWYALAIGVPALRSLEMRGCIWLNHCSLGLPNSFPSIERFLLSSSVGLEYGEIIVSVHKSMKYLGIGWNHEENDAPVLVDLRNGGSLGTLELISDPGYTLFFHSVLVFAGPCPGRILVPSTRPGLLREVDDSPPSKGIACTTPLESLSTRILSVLNFFAIVGPGGIESVPPDLRPGGVFFPHLIEAREFVFEFSSRWSAVRALVSSMTLEDTLSHDYRWEFVTEWRWHCLPPMFVTVRGTDLKWPIAIVRRPKDKQQLLRHTPIVLVDTSGGTRAPRPTFPDRV